MPMPTLAWFSPAAPWLKPEKENEYFCAPGPQICLQRKLGWTAPLICWWTANRPTPSLLDPKDLSATRVCSWARTTALSPHSRVIFDHRGYFSPAGRVNHCQTRRQIEAERFCPGDLVMWLNLRRNLLPRLNGRLVRAGQVNSMCLIFTTQLLTNLDSSRCEGRQHKWRVEASNHKGELRLTGSDQRDWRRLMYDKSMTNHLVFSP